MNDHREEPTDPKTVIENEAIAWFVKMRGEVDRGRKAEFDAWLNASPEHQRAIIGPKRISVPLPW